MPDRKRFAMWFKDEVTVEHHQLAEFFVLTAPDGQKAFVPARFIEHNGFRPVPELPHGQES